MENTIIRIKKTTATDLKKEKLTKLETYDEIINRLLKTKGGKSK